MINKLLINDINKTFVDNIAFIFICYPGSMGSDGTIEFILNDTSSFSCNVAYDMFDNYIDYDVLINKLSEYGLYLDEYANMNGFESLYLGGGGNFILIKQEYALDFYRLAYGLSPVQIYQKWQEFMNYILCTK